MAYLGNLVPRKIDKIFVNNQNPRNHRKMTKSEKDISCNLLTAFDYLMKSSQHNCK